LNGDIVRDVYDGQKIEILPFRKVTSPIVTMRRRSRNARRITGIIIKIADRVEMFHLERETLPNRQSAVELARSLHSLALAHIQTLNAAPSSRQENPSQAAEPQPGPPVLATTPEPPDLFDIDPPTLESASDPWDLSYPGWSRLGEWIEFGYSHS
jgi:hypothetical protein